MESPDEIESAVAFLAFAQIAFIAGIFLAVGDRMVEVWPSLPDAGSKSGVARSAA